MTNAITLQQEALMDRFGLKVAAHLDDQTLPHDISERLRIARQQAVSQRKKLTVAQTQTATSWSMSGGAAALGGGDFSDKPSWMQSLIGALPLVALAIGLIVVNAAHTDSRATELAEVDVALLTDDLPPAAHTDAGFTQYLKFGPPQAGQ
jgi:hypothetical protein